MEKGFFSAILYSKIQDKDNFDIYADNLDSFFKNLAQPELVKYVYFVDDSEKNFQDSLRQIISDLIRRNNFRVELIDVIANGSIYNAFNRVWGLIKTEYVVSFNSDHRLIQPLPLASIKKAFEKYPSIYSTIVLTTRSFGYSSSEALAQIKKDRPYFSVFGDNEMTTWFCFDEREKRIYSLPYKLYLQQKSGILPLEATGNELVALDIDEENNFWTTRKPARFLRGYYTNHEGFTGNPSVLRSEIIKKYLPLPKRYKKEGPAECQEMYFRRTDIDCKYRIGYINLQSFVISYKDLTKPLGNMEKEYWPTFLEKNGKPFIYKDFGIDKEEVIKNSEKISKESVFSLDCITCRLRAFLTPRFEELAIFLFGKSGARKTAKFFWRLFKGGF
jgi:hypothetical protein